MAPEELTLRRAERALALWLEKREVALGNSRLDGKIATYLRKTVIATEKAVRRSAGKGN